MMRRLLPFVIAVLLALVAPWLPGIAGQAALFPALALAPGMAVAPWLAGGGLPSLLLGFALGPLVSCAAGSALLGAGVPLATAARAIAAGGFALWLVAVLFAPRSSEDGGGLADAGASQRAAGPGDDEARRPEPLPARWGVAFPLALAGLIALTWLLNPYVRVYSDAWVHAGIAWDIVHHGIPPQDPRFAGLTLNYVWWFNLFLALLNGLGARDLFVSMQLVNSTNVAVVSALMVRLAWAIWGERRAVAGTALLLPVGLNAGAWLLWPITLARALVGAVRGGEEVRRVLHDVGLGRIEVIFSLSAPLADMTSFVDKFTVGTALNEAWVMMLLVLWAFVTGGGVRALVLAALGAAGMLFFHGVVGLSVIPVTLATIVLAALLATRAPWLADRRRLAAFAVAVIVGGLAALPYTRQISSGWSAEKSGVAHHYLHVGWVMPWTLLTAVGLVAWLAWRGLRRALAERRAGAARLALWALAMTGFAIVVQLPLGNESKFVFQVFFALVPLAGAAFVQWLDGVRARAPALATLIVAVLVFPLALTLACYVADRGGATNVALHPTPGEAALDQWIRARTEPEAVFVDANGMDRVMVLGERRLWAGTNAPPDKAAFPAAELAARRAVAADLYGPNPQPDADAAALARLGSPVYVIYRASATPGRSPWQAVAASPRFRPAYDADTVRVFKVAG